MKQYRATIYLAGKMADRAHQDIIDERNLAKRKLEACGFRVLCPTRGRNSFVVENTTDWGFVDRDLMDLRNSNCLLVLGWGKDVVDGTALEYGYMLWKLERPIVLIAPSFVGRRRWSNRYASYIAKDLDDAVEWIDKFLFVE